MHFALASKKTCLRVMPDQRSNGHTVSRLSAHIIWSTKYRYPVLIGDKQIRCRTLLIQICETEDLIIFERSYIQRPRPH